MRSGELARLAGVTIRALRHYHQVGILAEPERGGNGYRSYDVHDLIRVLRIKRLASLGIPLERMPDLLDDTDDDTGELLDDLDAELAGQIERLTRQRGLIAQLRAHDAAPDFPPELAPFLALFTATGLSPDLARFDRDQSLLLAHLVGEGGMPYLTGLYARLSEPGLVPMLTAVSERFSRLGPASSEHDITDLVDTFMVAVAPLVEDFTQSGSPIDLSAVSDLFSEHAADLLNEQQRRALEALERRLDQPRATAADG